VITSLGLLLEYGPNRDNDRLTLWEELSDIMDRWKVPWCIGDDFNAIRFLSERLRSVRYAASMEAFSQFIFDKGLLDIPMMGGQFHGLMVTLGLGLIGFYYPQGGKRDFRMWFKGDFLEYCLIISPLC
jgi:hypothetical protein